MAESKSASVSGTLLAGIGRESACSGYAEGLLFGHIRNYDVSEVEDAQEHVQTSHQNTVLQSFYTTGSAFSFYKSDGSVNEEVLKKIQEDNKDMVVVGWFVVGRSVLSPSVRHVSIHRSLADTLGSDRSLSPLFFLSVTVGKTSHCTKGMEFQLLSNTDPDSLALSPIELKVSNLTNDSHSEYGKFSSVGSLSFALPPLDQFPPQHIVDIEHSFQHNIEDLTARLDKLEKEEQTNELLRQENKKLAMQLA